MDFDFSNISIGGAIALTVIVSTLIGFMKGLVRMFFGLLALGAAAVAAYWGFQRGDAIAGYIISKPDPWMSGAVGVVLGLAVLFAARAIFSMLIKPTIVRDGRKRNMPAPGGLLGIIMGLGLVWFAIAAVRYVGTLTELQWVKNCLAEDGKITQVPKPALVTLRDVIDRTAPGKFHLEYDPLNSPVRAEIAKLRIMTEDPYAIVQAKVDPGVRSAFLQPDIRKFLENSQNLTIYVTESKFSHLLEAKNVKELAKNPAAREALLGLDVTKALNIQPPAPEKKPKEEKKEPAAPVDPNAPKPGSARIF